MKTKLLLALIFVGILVLAAAGFTVRRSRRAVRVVLRPTAPAEARPALA